MDLLLIGPGPVSLTCAVEVVDTAKPIVECPSIALTCGATGLPPAPAEGVAACGQPTSTTCYVCTGSACEPGADGLILWENFTEVPEAANYLCVVVVSRGADPRPEVPAPQNTNSCTGQISGAPEVRLEIDAIDPAPLWPPDGEMRTVSVPNECVSGASLVNACTGEITPVPISDLTIATTHVTSSEPDDSSGTLFQDWAGDGGAGCDMRIISPSTVALRQERAGRGDGRIYVVHFEVGHPDAPPVEGICRVVIPHSRKQPVVFGDLCSSCLGDGCAQVPSCPLLPAECP